MLKKQLGASYIGIFLGVIVAAMAIKIAVALWPAYWDDRIINKLIVDTLQKSTGSTPTAFKNELGRALDMNNIRDLKVDDIVTVTNVAGLEVKKDYEIRKPFVFNVDLVATFKQDFK